MKRLFTLLFMMLVIVLTGFHSKSQNITNYAFTAVSGSFTANVGGTTIAYSGTLDDGYASGIPIGFTFYYMGVPYTTVSVSTNGWLTFDQTLTTSGAANNLTSGTPRPVIAPLWDDIEVSVASGFNYLLSGSGPNRVLTIEWLNMYWNYTGTTAAISFQAKLYETTGVIEFVYRQETAAVTSGSASIGICGIPTGSGNFLSLDGTGTSPLASSTTETTTLATKPATGQIYRFTPVYTTTPAAPISLTFSGVGVSYLTVNWVDNSTTETYFTVLRSNDGGATYPVSTPVASTTTVGTGTAYNLPVTGLNAGTTYFFRVTANNEASPPSAYIQDSQATLPPTPISGNKNIPGDYPSLSSAFSEITANGLSGNVNLILQSGYTSASETFPIVGPSAASVGSYIVTVYPAATGLSITSGSASGTMDLNGSKNVIIDGRLNATGSSKDLTIENTNTAGYALRFINDANNNTIKYCFLKGVNSSTSSGVVVFSTTTGTIGNDNNLIDYCDIRDGSTTPTIGIYSLGTTTSVAHNNSGNTISNCNIFNYYNSTSTTYGGLGIFLSSGNTDWNILNNSFYQTSPRTVFGSGNNTNAISVSNSTSGNNFLVSGNYIGGSGPLCTGSAYTIGSSTSSVIFRAMTFTVGSTTPTSIQGNTIQNISITTTNASTAQSGISCVTGSFNVGTVTGNTVGSNTTTGSIAFVNAGTSTAVIFSGILAGTGTPAVIDISNNIVGGISISATSTGSVSCRGIGVQGAGTSYTISNNSIGSASVANSITNSSNQSILGIFSASSAPVNNITNNLIANLSQTGTSTSNVLRGMLIQGNSGGAFNTTNNTIRNLSSTSTSTGTGTTASVIGISHTAATTAGQTLSQNTIYGLSNSTPTVAAGVIGINYSGPTSGTNVIARNNIYGLTLSTTGAGFVTGLNINGGLSTYQNNMIAVGGGLTVGYTINGIYDGVGTNNYYFNSVYIDGAGVDGTGSSYAFNSVVTTNTRNFKNNIFFNARSNGTGTGKHYIVKYGGTTPSPAGLAADYNLFYGTGTGNVFGFYNSADVASLAAWRTATGNDNNSQNSNPQYIDPAGTTPNLHINPSTPTVAESSGVLIATITDDYDGQARADYTPTDIGADAGNFTPLDLVGPSIGYTLLPNTAILTNRTLTNVTISDASGVNVTTGTAPRIYFKRKTDANTYVDNLSTSNGWKYFETTQTASPYSFTIDYSLLFGGTGVSPTDTIQYFVVAQDLQATPLVSINSGAFNSTPASVALTPAAFPITGTINYFIFVPALAGTYNVGTGQTYTSLTADAATGIFKAINNGSVTGNVIINVVSDLTETGAVALNQFTEEPVGSNFTITIQPDGTTIRTISGTYSGGLIRLNGADRISIDGRSGGDGQYLTFANNATSGSVFQLISLGANAGATGNTIRNCNMNMGGNGSGTYGISVGGASNASTGADNDNNTIRNNSISKAYVGIWAQGTVATNPGAMDNLQIIGNTLGSGTLANYLGHDGIIVGYGTGCSVSQNTVYNIITTNTTPVGITASTGFISSVISRNSMHDITYTGTSGYGGRGMYINTANSASNLTIDNNLIYLIGGDGWSGFSNSSMTGIYCDGTMAGLNFYYNSIYMSGDFTRATATLTTAMLFYTSTITNITLKNNIFQNSMNNTGVTTDKNYAIYSTAPATSFTSIDYNDYYVSGAEGFVGYLGSDRLTLADWQAATLQDANSISADPLFLGTADLNIPSNSPVIGEGTPITGLDYDYANADRDDVAPSIGAYEGGLVITCPAPTNPETTFITSSGATMGWTDPTGTTWDLYIVTAGSPAPDETSTPTINNTNDNPYVWSGGAPATSYEWYVRTDCGGDDLSDVSFWTSPEPFTTACASFIPPYSQTFPTSSLPNCWSLSGPQNWLFTTTWPDYGADTVTDHTTGEGTFFAGVDGSGTAGLTGITMITSFFDVTAMSNPQLRFFMFNNNTSSALLADEQSLRIDLWDGAAWQNSIFFWDFGQNAPTWQEQIINLGAYAITGDIQLRFVVNKGTGSPYYDDMIIDDLFIEEGASCPPPTALDATEESTVTANLVWTAGGAETEWEYAYGLAPFAEPTGPGTVTGSNTDNVVSGLTSNTDYEFWVRAVCGVADTSTWAGPQAFTTLCDPFTDLNENFDAVTAPALPDCWNKYTSPSFTAQTVITYATAPYSSPNCVRLFNSTATLPSDAPMLITPQLSNLGGGTYRLHFFAKGAGTNLSVVIGTMADPANSATFTPFQTVSGLNTATFTECVVNFSAYSGTDTYIAFQHPMTASSSYIYLDDIMWEPMPDCAEPINLTVSAINSSGADLGWQATGSETTWNVEVGLPGFTPGTGAEVTGINGTVDNPWTVSGLNQTTTYEFYVQANCGYQFVDPRVDHFWMAQDENNNLMNELSGGTMNDPEEDGTWYLYDQTTPSWYNIWFYDGVLDTNKVKLVRMGFWVKRLNNDLEASISYVVNWSTPEWQDPGFPGPSQETFIMRSTVNGPVAINAYDPDFPNGQWIELEYLIENFNPEWVSVDLWGTNIQISNEEIAPPVTSPLRDWWIANPGPGGIIIHDCLPEAGASGAWAGPKSFETLQQPATLPFAETFESWPNNWTVVNGTQTNQWYVGTAAFYEGAQAAYVSNDGGLTNTYTITEPVGSTVHLYRDISFTGGTGGYVLNFRWKGQGEGSSTYYDYLRAYLVDLTTTPVAGTQLSSGQVGVTYNLQANWTEATISLPASLTGTNKRLVLTWRNDATVGTQPPAAVDNVSVFVAPFVWSGNTSTSWNDPTNWLNGVVPDATAQVIIPTDPASNPDRFPVIASGESFTIDKLDVGTGAIITVQTGGTLNITNP